MQWNYSTHPSAVILESHFAVNPRERRAGYNETKRKKGSKIHMAVDTLGDLLA